MAELERVVSASFAVNSIEEFDRSEIKQLPSNRSKALFDDAQVSKAHNALKSSGRPREERILSYSEIATPSSGTD